MIKEKIEQIFSSRSKTILLISFIVFLFLSSFALLLFSLDKIYSMNSDDLYQYLPIMNDYIEKIKAGQFDLYNLNIGLGESIFADIYYVPIDIFFLMTFLLSYLLNSVVAFSIVELIKMWLGVTLFAYFLSKKGYQNQTIFLMSLIYFISGGVIIFSVFPTYFSLVFYMPLSLLLLNRYLKGHKLLLPIYIFFLVLYNFYIAYTVIIFMAVYYVAEYLKSRTFILKRFLRDIFEFVSLAIIGVLMSSFILLPSAYHILMETMRIGGFYDKIIFPVSIYFLYIIKALKPAHPFSFFAFEQNYKIEHISIFVTVFGLILIVTTFFLNDKKSKINKYLLIGLFLVAFFPHLSMIISGNLSEPYTRWINFLPVFLIEIMAFVYEEYWIKNKKRGLFLASGFMIFFLEIISIGYYVFKINQINQILPANYNLVQIAFFEVLLLLPSTVALILYLFAIVIKKRHYFKSIIIIEFITSLSMLVVFPLKNDKELLNFYNDHKLTNEYLDLFTADDYFKRVYVYGDNSFNLNRYLKLPTNEIIYHSFFSQNLNDLLKTRNGIDNNILFNGSTNDFNPYWSKYFSYKYVLVDKQKPLYLDSDYYSLINETDEHFLYENMFYQPFLVYDKVYDYKSFIDFNKENYFFHDRINQIDDLVLLDFSRDNIQGDDFSYSNLNQQIDRSYTIGKKDAEFVEKISDKNYYSISNKGIINGKIKILINGYKENTAATVKALADEEIFDCQFENSTNSFDCSFNKMITGFNVEATSSDELVDIDYVLYETIEGIDYIYYELENNSITDENILSFNYFSNNITDPEILANYNEREKNVYISYENNEKQRCFNSFCFLKNNDPITYMLVSSSAFKINEDVQIVYGFDKLNLYSDESISVNKSLIYDNSNLTIKYKNISELDNNQIIVLPILYSQQWKSSDKSYKIVNVNGGLLGIIVEKNIQNVDLTIYFKPSYFEEGIIFSLIGIILYTGVLIRNELKLKRSKKDEKN